MVQKKRISKAGVTLLILLSFVLFVSSCKKNEGQNQQGGSGTETNEVNKEPGSQEAKTNNGLVPVEIKLPTPMFEGTPQNIKVPNLIKPRPAGVAREPFLAPPGTKNIALGKQIVGYDDVPIIGELEMIADGDKDAADTHYMELGPGLQCITLDLKQKYNIYGICVWHYHKQPRVYYDVIVQVAQDSDFITGVETVFNNDIENSAGMGVGEDKHYIETNEGKLIDAGGVQARYIRLCSNGNNQNEMNNYIEVEVYGKPLK